MKRKNGSYGPFFHLEAKMFETPVSGIIVGIVAIVMVGYIFYMAISGDQQYAENTEKMGPQFTCPEGQVLISAHGMRLTCVTGSVPKRNW